MSTEILTPKIQKRLDTWVQLKDSLKKNPTTTTSGKSIVLSREFGCEAYPVAEKLSMLLKEHKQENWNIYDKKLFKYVQEKEGLDEKLLQNIDSPMHHLDILSGLSPRWKTSSQLFEVLGKNILQLAEQGRCIIVGRGASFLTQSLPNCYHFRIEADLEFRIDSIARRMRIHRDEAKEIVISGEKERLLFLKKFLGTEDIGDINYYHLKFNNRKMSADDIAEVIFNYIAK